jgi:predicted DNA-binding transcriptional regulator AlpA
MYTTTSEYISSNQLRDRYGGRSHMWVERRLKDDATFPRPTYIGRLRFWKLSDLETWERAQAAKSREAA